MDNLAHAPDQTVASPESLRLEFRGSAGEYFRIWIVNTLLTILTLGIYSAWAKVRTRRYFLGNTYLAGSAFDFHAEPIKILYGRLIVGALVLVYFVGMKLNIFLPLFVLALFAAGFPWLLVRGMAFNLGNTSYRSLRFGFRRDYAGAYRTYAAAIGVLFAPIFLALPAYFLLSKFLFPFFMMVAFAVAFPAAIYLHHRFRITRTQFGTESFSFHGNWTGIWQIHFLALLAYVGSAAVAGGVAFVLALISEKLAFVALPLLYFSLFVALAFVRAHTYNYVADESSLGSLRFKADQSARSLAWIYATNFVACVFTLGLMIPWAVVRTARYKISRTEVLGNKEALENFVAAEQGRGSPVADAALDFWDIDFGF